MPPHSNLLIFLYIFCGYFSNSDGSIVVWNSKLSGDESVTVLHSPVKPSQPLTLFAMGVSNHFDKSLLLENC